MDRKSLIDKAGKIAVLMGGNSAEREISLLGGSAVLNTFLAMGMDAIGIDSGEKNLVAELQAVKPDRVFNMLHGRGGEDGVVQGLMQSLDISFTGSGVLASALAMDKLKSKLIWQQLGLMTAEFQLLTDKTDWQAVIDSMQKVVVKPVNEGSSIGMSIAASGGELKAAFELAAGYDSTVFAEKYITGEEFTVAILQTEALPAIQLQTDRKFYDFDAKYVDDDTRYICPVNLEAEVLDELNTLSLAAFRTLGCEGWGRVDLMRDKDGVFYLLEVNTVPGMTDHSLVPMAAKQAGLSFEDLLLKILIAKDGN